MSNKVYDRLKWVAILFLPALAKLVEGVFGVWGLPYGSQIASTIIYVQVFLGTILGVSSYLYNKAQKADPEDSGEGDEDA